jgi:glyoxylase-like metal-dependent hydrolase (beta-lactamase superfamily II)
MCEESITMQPVLNINVFTAPEKAMVAERVRPFGPPPTFDPSTSTLIFDEHDAVLVDTLMTVAETEALANWVALHHRNLVTIYITYGHFDHFVGPGRAATTVSRGAGYRHAEVGAADAQAI